MVAAASTSFPRGKKPHTQSAPAPVVAASKKGGVLPSKKRKHSTDETTPQAVVDQDGDATMAEEVDALFGKKGVAQQQQQQQKATASSLAKPKKRKVATTTDDMDDKTTKSRKDKDTDLATVLSYKSLTKGMLLFGCVRQVSDTELMISLPNKLNGVVTLEEVSDEWHAQVQKQKDSKTKKKDEDDDEERLAPLSELFRVGQFVPCVVLAKAKQDKAKKIHLSLRLSRIHAELSPQAITKGMAIYGTIASVEDHGAIVSLGIRGLHAFAPLATLASLPSVPKRGQHLLFVVSLVNEHTSTVTLTPDTTQVVKAVTRGDAFTMNQLLPGMLLNVRVEDVLTNGLRVNFLTFFSATVEQNHLSNPGQSDWHESYKKGLKGRARIVSVDRTNKTVTLSMAPHVVHLAVPEPAFVVGDVIENATIERIDAGIGMLVSLATGTKKAQDDDDDEDETKTTTTNNNWQRFQPAYVHISNAADGHVDKLEKKFSVHATIACRVIGFAPFDGIVNVSCKASSLQQIVLRHKDLTPGLKVKATILAIETWGILLEICEGVRGVVHAQHVPPFIALHKKTKGKEHNSNGKYAVGKTVDARVLRVDIENKKTYLTMKKQLVQAQDEVDVPLTSFEDATPGRVALGFITQIAEYGVVVSFYNNVYGLVPAALLHQAGITKLDEAYVLGQVVKACVTRCDVAKKRLVLTFDLTGSATKSSSTTSKPTSSPTNVALVGTTVTNVKVLEVETASFRVQTDDGLEGVLPFVQLTDFPRQTALVDALVAQYTVGDVMTEPLVVLAVTRDGMLSLSRKPLLVQAVASKHVPRTLDQVKEHALVVGYVASVSPSRGVFVRFLSDLTALAPKAFLSDKFVTQVEDGAFEMGETVVCRVEKVDKDKQQFVVGVRPHATLVRGISTMPTMLEALLDESCHALAQPSTTQPVYAVGKTVKAEYVGLRPYGAVFTLGNSADDDEDDEDDESTVTLIVPNVDKKTAKQWDEGAMVKTLVVDYDYEKRVYYGVIDTTLVEQGSKKARKQKSRLAKATTITTARVIAQTHELYAIVAFPDPQNKALEQIALLQVADYWCPSRTCGSLELEVGSTIARARVGVSALSLPSSPFDGVGVLVYEEEDVVVAKTTKKTEKSLSEHLPKYSAQELALGRLLTGRIVGIKEHTLEIKLKTASKCGMVVASVSIVDVDPSETDHPFDRFNVNQVVTGRVLAVVQKGANQRKPVSETNPASFHSLSLSLRSADVDGDDVRTDVAALVRADWQEQSAGRALLQPGTAVEGVVVEQEADGVLVRLSHRVVGFVSAIELASDVAVLNEFRTRFVVGKRVQAWILAVDEDKKRVDLSLIRAAPLKQLKVGSVVTGMITTKVSTVKAPAVMVQLGAHTVGRVCITELLPVSEWKNTMHTLPQFAHGQFVQCLVLASSSTQTDLSLRRDALVDPKTYMAKTQTTPSVGDLVTAIVASTTTSGCFVRVNRTTLGRVLLRDLSDEFIKDPVASFPAGKLVVGRVTKANADKQTLDLSLKASVVSEDVAMVKWSDLSVGKTVKGTITKVQAYGVFVKIEKSNISGLCHVSEVADERVTQPLSEIFSEGDYVKAKILKIEDRRVSFGLKPSYFEGEPESSDEEEDEEEDNEEEAEAMEVEDEEEDDEDDEEDDDDEEETPVAKTKAAVASDDDDDETMSSDDEEDDEGKTTSTVEFTWDGFANVLDSKTTKHAASDSDSDSDDDEPQSATTKHKKTKKHQSEEWIALREKALASSDERPQSADDFERLLAVNPQSSFLWIQYMAFHVSLTETEMARDVAIRATSAVSFRDEKEKLNVWVAYLNLEHDFGDEASFMRVFNSALRVNHQKRVYLQLVDLYVRAQEHKDVETTLTTMQKKFRKSKQVWLRALTYYVAQSAMAKAAETLQRALKTLEAHKHLTVILKYGQLMYEHGEVDKARTIFEGVLANYPKRLDVWNVYLDKEIKHGGGDLGLVRSLFERLVAMDFSAKKMKFLFKKFLQFEQDHGDDDGVEHVKELAKEFVAHAAK